MLTSRLRRAQLWIPYLHILWKLTNRSGVPVYLCPGCGRVCCLFGLFYGVLVLCCGEFDTSLVALFLAVAHSPNSLGEALSVFCFF